MTTALVTGAGGFVAHHLVAFLKKHAHYDRVIGVDLVTPESRGYSNAADHFITGDLRVAGFVDDLIAQTKPKHVYHLAADMGGLGYLTGNDAAVMLNNVRIDANVIGAAAGSKWVDRLLYTSSAVVYPVGLQHRADVTALKEDDAWPADPAEGGYGIEKLFTEQLCRFTAQQVDGFETRIVRLHNVYGPEGAWNDGKEKAPAAIMRKVAEAFLPYINSSGLISFTADQLCDFEPEIEVWGDGDQSRSFLYIDDAVRGIYAVMVSGYRGPLNVGSDELVTINELVDTTARVAGVKVEKRHDLDKPQGVRGRNSDNSLVTATTGWRPMYSLYDGIRETYPWIATQVRNSQQARIT